MAPQTVNVIPVRIPFRGMSTRYPLVAMPPEFAPWVANLEVQNGVLESPQGLVHSFNARVDTVMAIAQHPTDKDLIVHIDTQTTAQVSTFNVFDGTEADPSGSFATTGGWGTNPPVTTLGFNERVFFFLGPDYGVGVFDGSTFAQQAFTGPAELAGGWSYRNRMFVFEELQVAQQSFWYNPTVGAHTGTFTEFPISYVSQDNGNVMCGFSFTLSSGLQSQEIWCVVLDTGEVLAYQGTDPGNASTWSSVGRGRIGAPLGYQSFIEANGDIYVLTRQGVVSMRELFTSAQGNVQAASISSEIADYWQQLVEVSIANAPSKIWDPEIGLFRLAHGSYHQTKNKLLIFFPSTLQPRAGNAGEFGYERVAGPSMLIYDFNYQAWTVRKLDVFTSATSSVMCSYYHPSSDRLFIGSNDVTDEGGFELYSGSVYADNLIPSGGTAVYQDISPEIISAPLPVPGNKKVQAFQLLQAGDAEVKSATTLKARGNLGQVITGGTTNATSQDGIERSVYNVGIQTEFVQYDLSTTLDETAEVPYQLANINVLLEQGGVIG